MTSSIGIDPKWEFPRENIQLSDVLAEGQFTVLYKGIARSLREKPCEVAVKAVKGELLWLGRWYSEAWGCQSKPQYH